MGFIVYLLGLAVCAISAHDLPLINYLGLMVGTTIVYTGGLLNE
jgi:hypothetical protein